MTIVEVRKHSSVVAITREDYSLAFPQLSIAKNSFLQLSKLGRRGETESTQTSKGSKGDDSNPGSLDCESGILLLSYRAQSCEAGAMHDGESQFVVKFTGDRYGS